MFDVNPFVSLLQPAELAAAPLGVSLGLLLLVGYVVKRVADSHETVLEYAFRALKELLRIFKSVRRRKRPQKAKPKKAKPGKTKARRKKAQREKERNTRPKGK